MGQVSARQWEANLQWVPAEKLSAIRLVSEFGSEPVAWFPDDAVQANALTPAMAAMEPYTHDGIEGPIVEVEPGVWVKSALPDTSNRVTAPYSRDGTFSRVPVPAGVPVTISGWTIGGSSIQVFWSDLLGETVDTSQASIGSSAGWVRRHITVTPPAGAAQFSYRFFADRVAGPALTFTDTLGPYAPGKGCHRAVVHGFSESVLRATEDQQGSALSFTVSEVG